VNQCESSIYRWFLPKFLSFFFLGVVPIWQIFFWIFWDTVRINKNWFQGRITWNTAGHMLLFFDHQNMIIKWPQFLESPILNFGVYGHVGCDFTFCKTKPMSIFGKPGPWLEGFRPKVIDRLCFEFNQFDNAQGKPGSAPFPVGIFHGWDPSLQRKPDILAGEIRVRFWAGQLLFLELNSNILRG